jgi:hypothetical protein
MNEKMKNETWQNILTYLQNTINNIREDVFEDNDEVKAMGELALLELEIHDTVQKYWIVREDEK